MTPLRVAFDARDLAASAQRGMVRYIVGLARHLPAHGIHLTLFHRRREPLNTSHLTGLTCDVVGLPDCSVVFWEQVSVPATLAAGGYDLYHAVAERGVPLFAPCPVAFTVHSATAASYCDLVRRGLLPGPASQYLGYDPGQRKWHWATHYSRLQRLRADHIFTVSEFSRRELIRLLGVRPNRVSVSPLALPEPFTRATDPISTARTCDQFGIRSPYLLSVGGFEPHKNTSGVLEALVLARRQRPDLKVVAVGTGRAPESLLAEINRFGLVVGQDVIVLSDLRDQLIDIYDGAAVFISMSWRESFGVPALEAMARGVPVVASCWGAGPEVVNDAGLLIDPRNPKEAADAILQALEPETRAELATRGREQVTQFTWVRTAQQTAAVYRQLVGSGWGARG